MTKRTRTKRKSTRRTFGKTRTKARAPLELLQSSTRPSERNGQNLAKVIHAAFSMKRRYLARLIDKRSSLGRWLSQLEEDFCKHLNYPTLDDMPVTMRMVIQSTISDWLLLCLHPGYDNAKILRAAQNAVTRNCRELGLKPEPKSVQELQTYLQEEGYAVKD